MENKIIVVERKIILVGRENNSGRKILVVGKKNNSGRKILLVGKK